MSNQRPGDTIPHQKDIEGVIDKRLEGSGSGVRIFEVTDLVVPEGTIEPQVFGSFEVPIYSMLAMAFYIEVEAPPDPDGVQLQARFNGTVWESQAFVSANYFGNWEVIDLASTLAALDVFSAPPDSIVIEPMYYASNTTVGDVPTTADLTIVRARAAFLVI